ncbi:MAG: glutamine-hydrolyzing GMP synthase, partial [Lachnospiraceae bacterium]|nr:glutamine-hydrolyzing GMP synthase [Lachnospiraceae bacterium]
MKQDMIVILDLGSTENTVLARQIRDLGVYSEIHPHDITVEELKALDNVKGVILNGGENRVVDGAEVEICSELYGCGFPMISIDYPGSMCAKQYASLLTEEELKAF